MWSRRAQEYEAKISSGKIYDLAEVVRDLNKGDDIMITNQQRRQLFEKAYERLLTGFKSCGIKSRRCSKSLIRLLKKFEKQIQKVEEKPTTDDEVLNQR